MSNLYIIEGDGRRRPAVMVICSHCKKPFKKAKRLVGRCKNTFCSRKCMGLFRRNRITVKCAQCGNKIERTPSKLDISKSGLYFCDRSCKEEAQKIGGITEIQPNHYGNLSSRTKGDCLKNGYTSGRAQIATDANRVYDRTGKPRKCHICKYDVYVEICHIKSVSDFDETCQLSEINAPDNLVALCPNHHKEFDLGLITL